MRKKSPPTTICGKTYPEGYFGSPDIEELPVACIPEMEFIKKSINEYLSSINNKTPWEEVKNKFDLFDSAAESWAKAAFSDKHYLCRASYSNFFIGLYDNYTKGSESIEEKWQNLKASQEFEKFKNGDFNAKIGDQWGRSYGFVIGKCSLCSISKKKCFSFDNNEGYSIELLCKDCISAVLKNFKD